MATAVVVLNPEGAAAAAPSAPSLPGPIDLLERLRRHLREEIERRSQGIELTEVELANQKLRLINSVCKNLSEFFQRLGYIFEFPEGGDKFKISEIYVKFVNDDKGGRYILLFHLSNEAFVRVVSGDVFSAHRIQCEYFKSNPAAAKFVDYVLYSLNNLSVDGITEQLSRCFVDASHGPACEVLKLYGELYITLSGYQKHMHEAALFCVQREVQYLYRCLFGYKVEDISTSSGKHAHIKMRFGLYKSVVCFFVNKINLALPLPGGHMELYKQYLTESEDVRLDFDVSSNDLKGQNVTRSKSELNIDKFTDVFNALLAAIDDAVHQLFDVVSVYGRLTEPPSLATEIPQQMARDVMNNIFEIGDREFGKVIAAIESLFTMDGGLDHDDAQQLSLLIMRYIDYCRPDWSGLLDGFVSHESSAPPKPKSPPLDENDGAVAAVVMPSAPPLPQEAEKKDTTGLLFNVLGGPSVGAEANPAEDNPAADAVALDMMLPHAPVDVPAPAAPAPAVHVRVAVPG